MLAASFFRPHRRGRGWCWRRGWAAAWSRERCVPSFAQPAQPPARAPFALPPAPASLPMHISPRHPEHGPAGPQGEALASRSFWRPRFFASALSAGGQGLVLETRLGGGTVKKEVRTLVCPARPATC